METVKTREIPELEFVKREEVEIERLITYRHHREGGRIATYKYAGFMKEFIEFPNKPLEEYAYYKDKRNTYNSNYKGVYPPQQARFFTERTRNIIKDIQENGYREVKEVEINEAGRPRPAVAGLILDSGDIEILNGHHRCSIMYALGYKTIPMLLYKIKEKENVSGQS